MALTGIFSQSSQPELLAEVRRAYAAAAAEECGVEFISVARREVAEGQFEWHVHAGDGFVDLMTHFDSQNNRTPEGLAEHIQCNWDSDWDDLLNDPERPVSGGWIQRSEATQD